MRGTKSHVYYRGDVLLDADPATFEKLDDSFTRDRSHVWLGSSQISDDPASFQQIEGGGAKTSTAAYCYDGRVISRDPAHFEILRFGGKGTILSFTKDSAAVYYMCRPIPGADAATFRRLDGYGGYARDDQHVYWQRDAMSIADPHTFRVLNDNDHCAADQNHAYKSDSIVPNLNPREFPPGKPVIACTATGVTFGP
jgi:hypothetical protein